MPLTCNSTRDLLLDHVYGALDDAEDAAVHAHLRDCAACRAALDDAREKQSLLAAAARTESPNLRLTPPAPRAAFFTRRRLGVAAATLAAAAGGALAWRGAAVHDAEARWPRIAVLAPTSVQPGQPAEFLVDVTTVAGAPLPASVRLDVFGAQQNRLASKTAPTGADGKARLVFDPGLGAAGEQLRVEVAASLADGVERHASTIVVRDGTRFLARVATDKPLYRPGEPVRVRAVALERFRLTPGGSLPMQVDVLDPRGAKVASERIAAEQGVAAWEWPVPAGAPGGEYTLVLSGGDAAFAQFPKTERKFVVRSYRVPRIKGEVELDRDSYGPGDAGTASLTIERAEGGVPVGASLGCVVTVDGKEVSRETQTLPASGRAQVKFALPKDIAEGRGDVAVVVKDGGNVETVAKTIPIALGRLDVAYFPEGGDLVAGLANRVYFEVKTPTREPGDLVADVVDGAGRTVAVARVDDVGMGRFELTPTIGATYRLVARKPDGIKLSGDFPAVVQSGVVLRSLDDVTSAGAPIRVEAASTTAGRVSLSAFCRGALVAQDTVDLAADTPRVVELKPTSDVGGVVRVTAFDAAGVPRAERLVSLTPTHRIDLTVKPSAAKVAPGDPVRVQVTARDEKGAPVAAVLGVSVVDDAVVKLANDKDTADFPLHFLLGLEVDELEKADVYASGEHAARAVDRLLGVQGWRRFAWKTPAEFLAKNADKGARVVVANALDTPQHADNVREATAAVSDARRRADGQIADAAIVGAFAVAGLLGLWTLATGVASRRWLRAGGGLAACGAVVVAVALTNSSGAKYAEMAAVRAEAMAFAPEVAHRYRGPAGEVPPDAREPVDGPVNPDDVILVDRNAIPDAAIAVFAAAGGNAALGDLDGDGLLLLVPDAKKPAGARAAFVARRVLGGVGNDVNLLRADKRITLLSREYAHRKRPAADGARTDFAEVLYWNPLLVTGADGRATFDFDASDSVTTFSVGVDAHDARGALATSAAPFACRVPFFLEPKLPVALSAGDVLRLPVVVGNDTDAALDVEVALSLSNALLSRTSMKDAKDQALVPAGSRGRVLFELLAGRGRGDVALTLVGKARGLSDKSVRTIAVEPRGFPVELAKGGVLDKHAAFVVDLPAQFDRSTLSGALRLYPSTLATLEDGLDSMLQEPCGCFEQASSTNYPNVLVLNYLNETEHAAPAVAARAKDLLAHGYARLTGYECGHHGYEWFGGDPGHEALTAYGLMEFADMAKVHPVDAKMVERTRDWLLARRDGKGGFLRNDRALDSFGRAPQEITDAYCTWAITEADPKADVTKEVDRLVERATSSDDPYVVALASRSLANWRRANPVDETKTDPRPKALLDRLASMQKPDGRLAGKTTSITSSSGINLDVETTALAALAFAEEPSRLPNAQQAVNFLVAQRKRGGSFGATQATILALRGLVEYARASKRTAADHDILVTVNGRSVASRHVVAGAPGAIVFEKEILDALVAGENRVEIADASAETLPWAFAGRWSADLPATDSDCAVDVTTTLAKAVVAEGGTDRLDVVVRNKTADGVPMTLARVGLPAGLEAREDQLKELKKSGAVDFYETRPREVTLYFRGLAPHDEKRVALDLVASVPGEFEGPATSAYLYYGDDKKCWAAPLRVRVDATR